MEKKMVEEKVVIDRRIEEHNVNYRMMRKDRVDQGYRRSRLFRSEKRTSEAVQSVTGPELGIIIRGDYSEI